jgi:hypothetical protein
VVVGCSSFLHGRQKVKVSPHKFDAEPCMMASGYFDLPVLPWVAHANQMAGALCIGQHTHLAHGVKLNE